MGTSSRAVTTTGVPPVPAYGTGSIADVLPSAAAALGVPGFDDVLGLGRAERACVLLVDGLGWELLRRHPGEAPFLTSLAAAAGPLTAAFPATTATSLGSLGTGLPPGAHGILGYLVAVPGEGRLMNSLKWDPAIEPRRWQPSPTLFERIAGAPDGGGPDGGGRVAVSQVGPEKFAGSGLTVAVFRGAQFVAAESAGDLVARTAGAVAADSRSLVYAYYGDLDRTGHLRGCRSASWRYQLAHVDRVAEQLAGALPAGTLLVVTADHGMVDIDQADRVDVDAEPALRAGVALLGGEARARHLYTEPGADADVLAAWVERLGDRAWIASREQAVAEGWFGHTTAGMLPRIGDIVVAPYGDLAVVARRAEPHESALVGMHGSMTAEEQLVPLLTVRCAGPARGVTGLRY